MKTNGIIRKWVILLLVVSLQVPLAISVSAARTEILNDDFSGYNIGETLSGSKGWYGTNPTPPATPGAIVGTYTTVSESDILSGKMINSTNTNATTDMAYKRFTGGTVNLGVDADNYIVFNLKLGNNTSTADAKLFKVGLNKDGAYGLGTFNFGVQNDSSGIPYLYYRTGAGSDIRVAGKTLTRNTVYTIVARVRTSATVADRVDMWYYPTNVKQTTYAAAFYDTSINSTSDLAWLGVVGNMGNGQMIGNISVTKYPISSIMARDAVLGSVMVYPQFVAGDSIDNVTNSITLPTVGNTAGETTPSAITWASSDTTCISNSGVVTLPTTGDKKVLLTATVTNGEAVFKRTFAVTVKKPINPDEVAMENDFAWLTDSIIKGSNTTLNDVSSDLNLVSVGPSGSTISWSSDKTLYITDTGVVGSIPQNAIDGDRKAILTATVSKGSFSQNKIFTASKLAPSGVIINENFDYLSGTLASDITAELSKGFQGGYFKENELATPIDALVKYETSPIGEALRLTTDEDRQNKYAIRGLTASVNFESDKDYYIKWDQMLSYDVDNQSDEYLIQKLELIGGVASGLPSNVSFGLISGIQGGKELRPIIKVGDARILGKDLFYPGEMVTIVAKIEARSSGNDQFSLRVFRKNTLGTLDNAVATLSANLANEANKLMYYSGPCKIGAFGDFANLRMESVNRNDTALVSTITNAESYLETAIGLRTDDDILNAKTAISSIPTNFITVKDYLNARIWLSNQIRMDTPQFYTDSLNITRLTTGNLNCKVKAHNDTNSNIDSILAVAIYNNGVLEKIGLSNSTTITVASSNALTLETPINITNANGRTVKVFVLNGVDNIRPFAISTVMDSSNIK